MRLIDQLRSEHDTIDAVAGALRTFVARLTGAAADPKDGSRFLAFFRTYAEGFHHSREEEILFSSLARDAELPIDRGPIAVLGADHRRMADLLAEAAPLLVRRPSPDEVGPLQTMITRYARMLGAHIDAENSVLLPESEERLRRAGILELPTPSPRAEELEALAEGQALVLAYPPQPDPEAIRGQGCVVCPEYGASCDGLEQEWWSESEWDEFPHRVG